MSAAAFSKMLAILARWLGLGSVRNGIGVPCLLLPTFGVILLGVRTCGGDETSVFSALVVPLLARHGRAGHSTSMARDFEREDTPGSATKLYRFTMPN